MSRLPGGGSGELHSKSEQDEYKRVDKVKAAASQKQST